MGEEWEILLGDGIVLWVDGLMEIWGGVFLMIQTFPKLKTTTCKKPINHDWNQN